jgi:RNase H-like domain found in reverse transcriptase
MPIPRYKGLVPGIHDLLRGYSQFHMDPAKVEAVLGWERPKSAHDIQVFLGFANFYRRFIKGYSKITAPLTNLTRKEVKFKWSPEAEDTFSSLKQAFCTAPILRPFDPTKPAIIEVDASDFAYGGVLSRYHDGVVSLGDQELARIVQQRRGIDAA